jgi:hypothetical protein
VLFQTRRLVFERRWRVGMLGWRLPPSFGPSPREEIPPRMISVRSRNYPAMVLNRVTTTDPRTTGVRGRISLRRFSTNCSGQTDSQPVSIKCLRSGKSIRDLGALAYLLVSSLSLFPAAPIILRDTTAVTRSRMSHGHLLHCMQC